MITNSDLDLIARDDGERHTHPPESSPPPGAPVPSGEDDADTEDDVEPG